MVECFPGRRGSRNKGPVVPWLAKDEESIKIPKSKSFKFLRESIGKSVWIKRGRVSKSAGAWVMKEV